MEKEVPPDSDRKLSRKKLNISPQQAEVVLVKEKVCYFIPAIKRNF